MQKLKFYLTDKYKEMIKSKHKSTKKHFYACTLLMC